MALIWHSFGTHLALTGILSSTESSICFWLRHHLLPNVYRATLLVWQVIPKFISRLPFDLDPSKPAPQRSSAVHFLDPVLLLPCPAHASPRPIYDRYNMYQYATTRRADVLHLHAFAAFTYFTSYIQDVLGLISLIPAFQDYAGAKPSKPATPGLPWMHIACTSNGFSTKGLHQVLLRCWTRISIL